MSDDKKKDQEELDYNHRSRLQEIRLNVEKIKAEHEKAKKEKKKK